MCACVLYVYAVWGCDTCVNVNVCIYMRDIYVVMCMYISCIGYMRVYLSEYVSV